MEEKNSITESWKKLYASEQEAMKAWVENWKRVGPILEAIRKAEEEGRDPNEVIWRETLDSWHCMSPSHVPL
jgi:hypothetical protein